MDSAQICNFIQSSGKIFPSSYFYQFIKFIPSSKGCTFLTWCRCYRISTTMLFTYEEWERILNGAKPAWNKQISVDQICPSLSSQVTFFRCVCWRTPQGWGLVLVERKTFQMNPWAPAWWGLKSCFLASQQQRAAGSTWVMSSCGSIGLLWRDSRNM